MAWISVHEQVLGGKLRSLAKGIGCSQNEALGILVRLWLWGINNAKKEGRIIGADKDDVADILAVGLRRGLSADSVVDALIASQWIDLDDGIFIHDWEEWQGQFYKAIETRERDAERKRKERLKKKGLLPAEGNSTEQNHSQPVLPLPTGKPKKSSEAGVSTDFEAFWDEYPRKVGKGEAYKKYLARLKDGWSPAELQQAAHNYARKCEDDHTEAKYIKHPKTFLSESTPFQDYLEGHARTANPIMVDDDDDPYAEWRR